MGIIGYEQITIIARGYVITWNVIFIFDMKLHSCHRAFAILGYFNFFKAARVLI